ncbi:MAG TPA: hypothetical protein VHB23_07225 [Devosiaceae bacterium]|jgi:thioredoxin reductase|nr:hypothetical protein [Devosiaceae bacterium]
MNSWVDIVVAGRDDEAVTDAALGLLRQGRRVLVVLGEGTPGRALRLRRHLLEASGAGSRQLMVMTHAEVVCVAGTARVEAVVIRHSRSGRLSAVNTGAFIRVPEGPTPSW